jgi:hypothetical protein
MEHYNINDIASDYKAAVLAAELIETGIPADQVFIWPVGGGVRSFSKDIVSVEKYTPESGYQDLICIKSSREGLYDMLPEGLFHQHTPYASTTRATDIVDQIKQHREEEKDARRFFLPFEAEINFLRVVTEIYENRVDKKHTYEDLINIFRPQWEIFDILNLHQGNIFLHAIPLIASTRGNLSFFENLLQLLLDLPVQVYYSPLPAKTNPSPVACVLGECSLGIDLFPGTAFDEGVDEIVIEFGPLTATEAVSLLPGSHNERIVQLLTRYCLPAESEVRIQLELRKEAQSLQLHKESANDVLGHTTFL